MGDGLLMPSHLVILALIAVLFFGPKRLPEFGRSLGQGIRSFREGLSDTGSETPPEARQEPDAERTLPPERSR